jgi:hypothetical protein
MRLGGQHQQRELINSLFRNASLSFLNNFLTFQPPISRNTSAIIPIIISHKHIISPARVPYQTPAT